MNKTIKIIMSFFIISILLIKCGSNNDKNESDISLEIKERLPSDWNASEDWQEFWIIK